MYEYKVLVVDDEYHAIDMISRLLGQMEGTSIEVFTARSVGEALRVLELGRMDMVITDIEMPGKNGIELVSQIRSRWKQCRVVVLTAYSDFQYAYSALQLHADGYILKTESDADIIGKLRDVLLSVESDLRASACYAEKKMNHIRSVRQSALLELLETRMDSPQQLDWLERMGFSRVQRLYLIACRPIQANCRMVGETVLHELFGHYFRDSVCRMDLACMGENEFNWLIEPSDAPERADANHILGLLEMVQGACQNAYSLPLSFIFSAFDRNAELLCDVHQRIQAAFVAMNEPTSCFIYYLKPRDSDALAFSSIPSTTLKWLCRYIDDNLNADLSLVNLASLTGYNPQYLSGLFRRRFGMTLSHYITQRRLTVAQELLADSRVPIQDIVLRLGFASHSYFSRFIRKATGLTPIQLRSQLLDEQSSS